MDTDEKMRLDNRQPLTCESGPEGVKSRGMTKKLVESLMTDGEEMLEQEMEEQQMQPEAPHEIDMDAWAWSAGGAELYPPGHRLEEWRRHGRNSTAVFWRCKRILAVVGIHAGIQDDEESF